MYMMKTMWIFILTMEEAIILILFPLTGQYQTYQPHARPPVGFTFPDNSKDSATFSIVHVINETTADDICMQNDTVVFYQKFYELIMLTMMAHLKQDTGSHLPAQNLLTSLR